LPRITERPLFRFIIVALLLIGLLITYQIAPFLAYGVPGVMIFSVNQSSPSIKSVNILSGYGEWVAFEYQRSVEAKWESLVGKRLVQTQLKVKIGVKIETSSLASPSFLTEIEIPPFLIDETEDELFYKNITIHAYSYSFRVTTAWTGDVKVSILKEEEWGLIPWTVPSKEDMVKQSLNDMLIPDFNNKWSIAANVLFSLTAATLAQDQMAILRPDYVGLAGMWLQDYRIYGRVSGTAAEIQPQTVGTQVTLYRDKDLTSPCWTPDYTAGAPEITDDVAYWLENFAAKSAWWQINIVNLGSKLVFDDKQTFPNYAVFAWKHYGDEPPSVIQWFRVDVLFKVTEDWVVPKIPQYEIPPEQKEQQKIIVEEKPPDWGTPLDLPEKEAYRLKLQQVLPIIIAILIGIIIVIVIYALVKPKITGEK